MILKTSWAMLAAAFLSFALGQYLMHRSRTLARVDYVTWQRHVDVAEILWLACIALIGFSVFLAALAVWS